MISFRFTRHNDELKLFGVINEFCDLSAIFDGKAEKSFFDMSGIRLINSLGVRAWVNYLVNYSSTIIYRNCPILVIDKFNHIPKFIGPNSQIESFYSMIHCNDCGNEAQILLEINKNFDAKNLKLITPHKCSACNKEIDTDFTDESYFNFFKHLKNFKENKSEKEKLEEKQAEIDNRPIRIRKPLFTKIFMPDKEYRYSDAAFTTFTENISEGGLFICTYMQFELYSRFKVEFSLKLHETSHTVKTNVEVRWIRKEKPAKNVLPGIGVLFIDINEEDLRYVKEYVKSFTDKPDE